VAAQRADPATGVHGDRGRRRASIDGRSRTAPAPSNSPSGTPGAVGYARVSTEDQEQRGSSLEEQRAKALAYIEDHALRHVATPSDALSGKTLDRPGLREALAFLEAGEAATLVVTKLDRLTRNIRDGEELLERYFLDRFTLVCLAQPVDTATAMGRFMYRLTIILGQFEREQTAERTKSTLAHKRATGGGIPQVAPAAAARITELAAAGVSLRGICRTLTSEGVPTTKGGRWGPETVRKVLARTDPHIFK
jgi:site-specific DNA recombinase